MARTESRSTPLGAPAPDFSLLDVKTGRFVSLDDFAGARGLLVMFICNHCPFVIHIREQLAAVAREYADKGMGIVAICSNDAISYPADHPDRMKEEAEARGYVFPYLYDETQEVALAYGATCTPDIFLFDGLFDGARKLVYHGQFDDSRPGNQVPVTGRDLRAAMDAVLAGREPSTEQKPSIGCSIKWKPGKAPV